MCQKYLYCGKALIFSALVFENQMIPDSFRLIVQNRFCPCPSFAQGQNNI